MNLAQTTKIVKMPSVYIVNVKVNYSILQCSINRIETVAPSCSDGVKNGDEEGIDCGATCGKSCNGKYCQKGANCWSGVCNSKKICAGRH